MNELPPLEYLACCCCSDSTKGRQWWNRDTGFGLCDRCVDLCQVSDVPVGGTALSYGVRGVHWGLATEPAEADATTI